MSPTFPKASRLLLSQDFRTVRKEGTQKSGRYILVSQRLTSHRSRLGITASKKYGKAHDRNRFKRIVREAFRLCRDQIPKGLEIEVIPKKAAIHASMQDIQCELLNLCVPPNEIQAVSPTSCQTAPLSAV